MCVCVCVCVCVFAETNGVFCSSVVLFYGACPGFVFSHVCVWRRVCVLSTPLKGLLLSRAGAGGCEQMGCGHLQGVSVLREPAADGDHVLCLPGERPLRRLHRHHILVECRTGFKIRIQV